VALNLSEKLRLLVICVSCRSCWIHLSTLSSFAGPLQPDTDGIFAKKGDGQDGGLTPKI
jgi:hypothetical protein